MEQPTQYFKYGVIDRLIEKHARALQSGRFACLGFPRPELRTLPHFATVSYLSWLLPWLILKASSYLT